MGDKQRSIQRCRATQWVTGQYDGWRQTAVALTRTKPHERRANAAAAEATPRRGLSLFAGRFQFGRHPHKVGKRMGGHLLHDIAAMNLQSDFRNPQGRGGLFVE